MDGAQASGEGRTDRMPRSTMTVEQLQAAAMLMGSDVWYDHHDHTFMVPPKNGGAAGALCADTMENVDHDYNERCRRVRAGELGAVDAIEETRGGKIT